VQRHIKERKIDYPLLFDCGGRMWKELGLRAYPTAFLIGRDGKADWEGTLSTKKARQSVKKRIEKLTRPKPKK